MTMPKMPTIDDDLASREKSVEYNEHSGKVDQRVRSHDAGGFETAMTDFSEYDDGYGSNVAHGDLSVQRLTERSREGVLNHDSYPTPLDTEPYQGKK
jgi:hypothetical protein